MISLKLVRLLKNPAEMVNIGLTVNSGTLQMAQKCNVWVGHESSPWNCWSLKGYYPAQTVWKTVDLLIHCLSTYLSSCVIVAEVAD